MKGCKFTKKQLDKRGNRNFGWAEGENRGGKPYDPPKGWIGIGLKVMDEYGDNTWIGMKNIPGEWCIAYHGVGRCQDSDQIKNTTRLIYTGRFNPGQAQKHKGCKDQIHSGEVGIGVYFTLKMQKFMQEYQR